jgi:hypothetical protein
MSLLAVVFFTALLGLAGRNPGNGLEPPRRVHACSGLRRWFAETDRHRSARCRYCFRPIEH